MFKKIGLAVLFLALGSVTALAADFNGKWTADITTQRGTQTLTFDFHVNGATLTGTVTRTFAGGQAPGGAAPAPADIQEGKIDGDNISFVQVMNFNGNEMRITYKGTIDGDTIKFTRQSGDRPASDFVAKRAK